MEVAGVCVPARVSSKQSVEALPGSVRVYTVHRVADQQSGMILEIFSYTGKVDSYLNPTTSQHRCSANTRTHQNVRTSETASGENNCFPNTQLRYPSLVIHVGDGGRSFAVYSYPKYGA